MRLISLTVLCSALLAASGVQAENLVRNPSFQGLAEWQLPDDSSQIAAEAGVLRLGAPRLLMQQSIPLVPQDSYRLSYEFQAPASARCRIYLEWTRNTAEGVQWLGSGAGFTAGDGGWITVSREFDYTADSVPPYLVVQSAGDGPVAVRNLSVERLERIQPTPGNLVRNPSFVRFLEWQLPADRSEITAEAGVLRLGAPRVLQQQSIPLAPQDSYRLSYEFQASASAQCRIYLDWTQNTAEGVLWHGSGAGFIAGDGGWTAVSREFDYTADSTPPYLVIQSAGDGPVAIRNLRVERLERIQMASEIGGEWNCPTGSRVVSLEGHPAIETGSGTLRIVGVPVTAGREYALSCSMLGRGNSGEVSGYHPYRISVTFPEAGITEDGPWDDTQADSVQRKSFTFIAPPGATRAEIAWRIMTQGRMTVGALELSERVIPLEERFKIELASPIYRNSIYASMPVDAIAGRVAGDLPIASCRVELRRGGNLLSRSDGAEFSFPAAALAEGDYRLDAEAVLENGETVQIGAGVRKLPPSPFEVVIGDDLNLYVNGELFYPVGFFQIVGNTDATFADAASNGVNMILLEGVNTAEQLLPILELSARHGVKVMLYTWNMRGVDAASEARWRQHLAGLLTPEALAHPALLGYFLDDEPSWGGRPLNWLTGSYALLKELDPYRPIWINAAPRGTVGEHRDYSAACDIYGVDIYPVPSPDPHGALDDKRLTVVGAYAERMALATGYRKPVWMVLQGFAWGSYTGASQGIYPDATQNRFMLYDALIHHGTGVSYWGTQYIGDPDFYSVLFRGTREMHAMSGLLGSGRPVEGVVSDNPAIQLHTLELDGHRYLIALNA